MAKRQSRFVSVTLDVDSEGAVKGIKDASGGVRKFGKDLDDTGKRADTFGNKVNVAIGVIAVAAIVQLTGAMRRLISQGQQLLRSSEKIEDIAFGFETVFGRSTAAVQEFIDGWAHMAGLTYHEARDLIRVSGAIADGMGFTEEKRAELSVGLAKLAGDLMSFNDVPIDQVFNALHGALVGNTQALKQFGIVIQAEDINQRALLETGKQNARQLTQQEKAVATMGLMYERAGVQVGDLTNNLDASSNMGNRARAEFRQLAETFTQELIPVAYALNERLLELSGNEELQEWVRRMAVAISEQLVRGIELASAAIRVLIDHREGIQTTVTWIARLTTVVIAFSAGMRIANVLILAQTRFLAGWRTVVLAAAASKAFLTGNVTRLAAALKLLGVSFRALGVAMASNPFGLLLGVLSAATAAWYLFRRGADEATKTLREQRDAAIETRDALREMSAEGAAHELMQAREKLVDLEEELATVQAETQAKWSEWVAARGKAYQGILYQELKILQDHRDTLQETVDVYRDIESEAQRIVDVSLSGQLAIARAELQNAQNRRANTRAEINTLLHINLLEQQIRDSAALTTAERQKQLSLLQAQREFLEGIRLGRVDDSEIARLQETVDLLEKQLGITRDLNSPATPGGDDAARQQRLERERELQRMRVEVMEDGIAKTVALIDLEFDEREARMRERYGRLSDEEIRLLQQQRHNAIVAAFERMDIGDLPEVDVEIQLNPIINVGDQLRGDIAVVDGQLRAGLLRSINAVDQALQDMGMAFGAAVTDEDRERIRLMIEELELLRQKMVEVGDTGVDIGAQLEGVLASSIVSFSELIGEAFAGLDETSGTMSERVLLILTGMVRQIGEILVATGVGMLALRAVLKNPFASIAAGVAMIALAAGAQAAIQRTISSRNEASSESTRPVQRSSESASYTPFGGARAKGGPISSGYSYLVGEQGPELILPKHDGFVFPASVTRGILSGQQQPGVGQQSVSIQVEPTRRVTTEQINIDHIQLVRKVEEGVRVRDKHLGRL